MELKKELNELYKKLITEGRLYLERLESLPLTSNNAIIVCRSLDKVEYYAKLYLKTYLVKRKLSSEEKEMYLFFNPITYILDDFETRNSFMGISRELENLIKRIINLQKGVDEK